jgi:two-component system sensor histidine kinase DegS
VTRPAANVLDVAERRLVRLGLDIHDGPVQDVAALVADVDLVRERLEETAPAAAAALADVEDRLRVLHQELRDLAQSLESRALVERDLREILEREATVFRGRTSIALDVTVSGDLEGLTASQRTAVARIVQEAMSNIREHSRATAARVEVEAGDEEIRVSIWDDGVGFNPGRARPTSRNGRLGLLGMHERVRLLNGKLEIETAPGGPTSITACVPRWRPGSNR